MNIISALPYLDPIYTRQPIAYILKRFLKTHHIKINSTVLHQKLIEHPNFPSLLSISEVLTSINVPNQAYKIDLEGLKENFETALFIYLKIDRGTFGILEKIKNGEFRVITENEDSTWFTEDEFKEVWAGIILDVERTNDVEKSYESQNTSTAINTKYIWTVCLALISFSFLQDHFGRLSLGLYFLLVLNIAGGLISWLLVLQNLNKNNVLIRQLCQNETHKGCNSVLNNNTAKLTPWFSMSDAGLVYFIGMTLAVLFFNRNSSI